MSAFDQLDLPAWGPLFDQNLARIAAHFGSDRSDRWLPTPSCTAAVGLAISDHPWAPGDRLLIGAFEHHALAGAAERLSMHGVEVVILPPAGRDPLDLVALEEELGRGARLLALSAASSVTGALLPVREAVAMARSAGVPTLMDAAQVAGWLPVRAADAELIAIAGHKALRGPWGLGLLYVAPGVGLQSPVATCELPVDGAAPSCATMPGFCDAGSVNQRALAGLAAAVEDLDEAALAARLAHGRGLIAALQEGLGALGGFAVLGPTEPQKRVPTVAFTKEGCPPARVRAAAKEQGVHLGAGQFCAPLAHQTLGPGPQGCVRISVGPDTTYGDIDQTLDALGAV